MRIEVHDEVLYNERMQTVIANMASKSFSRVNVGNCELGKLWTASFYFLLI